MSLAPTQAVEDSPANEVSAFKKAFARRSEMIREGMSNSGHERNCCFLNTRTGRFANLSAAAGLDHIGDGRAYALTDWDHDGDIDLWATNRTGPRVQFFRNNGVSSSHFVAVKLQGNGTTTNRDAIGARVEIILPDDDGKKLIKTVRAGEGFLGQSTKSLLFGLGAKSHIDRLIVHWPGADQEEFSDLATNGHYLIVQGSGKSRRWIPQKRTALPTAPRDDFAKKSRRARIQLRHRIPMPILDYERVDGTNQSLNLEGNSPTLVNLWASWCQPCLAELIDFHKHEDRLRTTGLNLLALSVDKLAQDGASNAQAAGEFLSRQSFPFEAGFATSRFMRNLDAVHFFLYGVQRPTTVPMNMLFDRQGRLAIIYTGKVDIDVLIADLEQLTLGDLAWFETSLPFTGNWIEKPPKPNLGSLVDAFLDRGLAQEGRQYFDRFDDVLANYSKLPNLLVQLGSRHGDEGDFDEAIKRFRQAIEVDPRNAVAHMRLSKLFLHQRKFKEATYHSRMAIEIRPDFVEAHFILATLFNHEGNHEEAITHLKKLVQLEPDSLKSHMFLGNAYEQQLQWEKAAEQFHQAIEIEPDAFEGHFRLGHALQRGGQPVEAASAYRQAGQINPDIIKRHFLLAFDLEAEGDVAGAIKHFRLAHQLDPDSAFIINALAWMLATQATPDQHDLAEALRLAQLAAEKTNYKHPQFLDTLATAYASSGDFDKAISTAKKAIAIAKASNNQKLADEIRTRIRQYQRHEP